MSGILLGITMYATSSPRITSIGTLQCVHELGRCTTAVLGVTNVLYWLNSEVTWQGIGRGIAAVIVVML